MVDSIIPGAAVKSTLLSIQRARENVDRASERLASGLRVNRATDQPRNFFQASALNHTANNFNSLLDRMGMGIRTIQTAFTGLEQLENILELAEIKAVEAKEALEKTSSALPNMILADDPVGYFRLNDVSTGSPENLGSLGAGHMTSYVNGVTQGDEILFYGAGGLPARFNGIDQFAAIGVDDSINTLGPYAEKTVELIFNANTVSGRQVLWEEGGPVNNLSIYIDDGLLYVNGRTTNAGGYGPLNINTPIEAGISYHVALVQDANNNYFTGYLNGEEFASGGAFIPVAMGSHPNRNAIGAIDEYVYFHDDGPGTAPNTQAVRPDGSFAFNGQISDIAFYNSIISQDDLRARYEATSLPLAEQYRLDTLDFLNQIQDIVEDSHFRGINLLQKEKLIVDFNDTKTSKLKVDGRDFNIESLRLQDINFQKPSQVAESISRIRNAIKEVREYASSLTNDLNVIQIRQEFTQNKIVNHRAGATDLLIADQNEEGANLLAAQTRVDLSTTALSLASQSQASILQIFGTGSNLFLT